MQIYLKVLVWSKKNENLRIGGVIGIDTAVEAVAYTVYTVVVVDCDLPLMLYSSRVLYSSSKAGTVVVVEWGSEAAEWLNILS